MAFTPSYCRGRDHKFSTTILPSVVDGGNDGKDGKGNQYNQPPSQSCPQGDIVLAVFT